MKIKKWILIVAGIIFAGSLAIAIISPNGTKINSIVIGIMGSSFVSFVIELPDYYIECYSAKKRFFGDVFAMWTNMRQYLYWVNYIYNNKSFPIEENMPFQNFDMIGRLVYDLRFIDDEFYKNNLKYKKLFNEVNGINNEIYHNKESLEHFILEKKIELLKSGEDRQLASLNMQEELSTLRNKTEEKISLLEKEFARVLNKKEREAFEEAKKIVNEKINKTEFFKAEFK